MEKLVLIFVRTHREKNCGIYVACMEALVFVFFSLDHMNYSRWVNVQMEIMKTLPLAALTMFIEGNWVVPKSTRRFSAMPVDQAHEQVNKRVK
ncbi:hypothetical protein LSAT2_011369, partial [Lamellibrachia satsuma]